MSLPFGSREWPPSGGLLCVWSQEIRDRVVLVGDLFVASRRTLIREPLEVISRETRDGNRRVMH